MLYLTNHTCLSARDAAIARRFRAACNSSRVWLFGFHAVIKLRSSLFVLAVDTALGVRGNGADQALFSHLLDTSAS